MGKKLILYMLAVVLVCSISLVGAVEYKQNTDITLRHSVRVQDAPTSSASCNITINYIPESRALVKYEEMTYEAESETYYYLLNKTNITKSGEYCYDITCLDAGLNETSNFCFDVSPTGEEYTTAQSITYIFILILSLSLLGLCIYGAIVIPFANSRNSENEIIQVNYRKHMKIFMISMSYLILMWISYITYNISLGYLQLFAIANFFKFIYKFMLAFTLPISVVAILVFFIVFINDIKTDNLLKRGFTVK